jgi:hypothetical protein
MANEGDSLLREVDDELRREQLEKLWKKYSSLIFTAAALIVLGVGGYKFLEHRRIAAAQAAGAEFASAMRLDADKKADEAAKALQAIADSGPKGYAALAQLHIAGNDVKAGKTAEALKVYEALASDATSDELLKSYAQLQAAALRLADADWTEMQNRLTPLAVDKGAFKVSARELLGLAAYKGGKLDEARKYLEPLLIDPTASRAIQDRIKIVMAGIAGSEIAAKAAAGSAPASPGAAPEPGADKKAEPEKK